MGNCCSDVAGGQSAVGGTGVSTGNQANAPNEAVDAFLKSRGYQGLYSQIEALGSSLSPSPCLHLIFIQLLYLIIRTYNFFFYVFLSSVN